MADQKSESFGDCEIDHPKSGKLVPVSGTELMAYGTVDLSTRGVPQNVIVKVNDANDRNMNIDNDGFWWGQIPVSPTPGPNYNDHKVSLHVYWANYQCTATENQVKAKSIP